MYIGVAMLPLKKSDTHALLISCKKVVMTCWTKMHMYSMLRGNIRCIFLIFPLLCSPPPPPPPGDGSCLLGSFRPEGPLRWRAALAASAPCDFTRRRRKNFLTSLIM